MHSFAVEMAAMDILETVRPTVTCSRTRQSDRQTDRHYFNHIFACLSYTYLFNIPIQNGVIVCCTAVPQIIYPPQPLFGCHCPPPIRSSPFPELSSSPLNTQVSAALITASKDSSGQPRCLQCCNEEIGRGNNSEAKK